MIDITNSLIARFDQSGTILQSFELASLYRFSQQLRYLLPVPFVTEFKIFCVWGKCTSTYSNCAQVFILLRRKRGVGMSRYDKKCGLTITLAIRTTMES